MDKTETDLYNLQVAHGRGWRIGYNFPTRECPYADDETEMAHAWLDAYYLGVQARRTVTMAVQSLKKKMNRRLPRRMAYAPDALSRLVSLRTPNSHGMMYYATHLTLC